MLYIAMNLKINIEYRNLMAPVLWIANSCKSASIQFLMYVT